MRLFKRKKGNMQKALEKQREEESKKEWYIINLYVTGRKDAIVIGGSWYQLKALKADIETHTKNKDLFIKFTHTLDYLSEFLLRIDKITHLHLKTCPLYPHWMDFEIGKGTQIKFIGGKK